MNMQSLVVFVVLIVLVPSSFSAEWHSKSQCTQKEFANHMDINCHQDEFILIGWSHYGTKKANATLKSNSQRCEPSNNDCIMDYTHKIAELCNGVSTCEVILTQQFIHKCSDEATYLFISYQCINHSTVVDVCSQRRVTSSNGIHLISPSFPNEYPNNINCTCSVESSHSSTVIIDVESLSFNLQDNDQFLSLSGTIPFGASFLTSPNRLDLKFLTDETLSQSGFWLRLQGYDQCHADEFTLGSKCMKIISQKQSWKSAHEKCLSMKSNLIRLHDIIEERKLGYFFSTHAQQPQVPFWISNEKDKYDGEITQPVVCRGCLSKGQLFLPREVRSWWPWRSSSDKGKCVLRTQDGWIKRPCHEEQAFICEREMNQTSIPLTLRCGNAPPAIPLTTKTTTTTMTTATTAILTKASTETSRQSVSEPPLSANQISSKSNPFVANVSLSTSGAPEKTTISTRTSVIDPTILGAVLGGVAIAIFAMNIVVCFLCKKRIQKQSNCKTPNESQASLTHEELQRSLMQHLYHEQTNTISSTSTSSSSSKHSQSKSNDTTTTNVHLLQLSSPLHAPQSYMTHSNSSTTALCFRNPHIGSMINGDPVDYHVYETIPSESLSYAVCTAHSAFKPVGPPTSHSIRPYYPRTNILYHPSGSSKQSYDTLSVPSSTTVLMPIYCHHPSSQCSNGTFRQHLVPAQMTAQEQICSGSESIV